jgi:hypothetical protein
VDFGAAAEEVEGVPAGDDGTAAEPLTSVEAADSVPVLFRPCSMIAVRNQAGRGVASHCVVDTVEVRSRLTGAGSGRLGSGT